MRLAVEFDVPVTGGDIVSYFKANLQPPEDVSLIRGEIERVATKYAADIKSGFKKEQAL